MRLAAALRPALAARGVPGRVYVDNGSAFVDAWLLRACAKLGIRLVHSTPDRPQGRGKIERFFRTVREQFLVEIADTSADDLADRQLTDAGAARAQRAVHRLGRDRLPPPGAFRDRADPAGPLERRLAPAGHGPAMPAADALTEAFLWSEHRTVTKTATVSLHGNTYQVDAALVGRKVELVFDPFDLDTHRGPLPRARLRARRCRTGSAGTPTPRPDPRHPSRRRRRRPGSTTCA